MAVFIFTYENSEWKNAWTHRKPVCLYLPIWLCRCHQHSQHPQVVPNHNITTTDGQVLKAVGMGDAQIKLPNGGDKQSKVVLKDAIYAHNIAFMLILVSCLDIAKYSVTFSGGICTIKSMTGCTIMMILCTNGLYHIMAVKGSTSINYANVASIKMTISKAHQKLGWCDKAYNIPRPHHWHSTRPRLQTWVLQVVCQGQVGLAAIPEKVTNTCHWIWRMHPLGHLETCSSQKPQQQPLHSCMDWRCHAWNKALLPDEQEPDHSVI